MAFYATVKPQNLMEYALPDSLGCINPRKLTKVRTFKAEVLQYKPKTTQVYIYQCILTMVSHICDKGFWGILSTTTVELPISASDWLLAAQVNTYDNTPLKIDPNDLDTRVSPMRKKETLCMEQAHTLSSERD